MLTLVDACSDGTGKVRFDDALEEPPKRLAGLIAATCAGAKWAIARIFVGKCL
jgi:hypothetical protein